MRCLILAALIGICTASTLYQGGRQIYFTDDDNVMVHGVNGNYLTLTRFPGQKYIDVIINGVDTPMKKFRIDSQMCQVLNLQGFNTEQALRRDYLTTGDLFNQGQIYNTHLFNILKNNQGLLDRNQYNQVLNMVDVHVQEGKVCKVIYQLLAYLDKIVNVEIIQNTFFQTGHRVQFTDNDNVMVHGLQGDFFTLTRFPGQKFIDIVINGKDTPMKKIRINEQTCQVLNLEEFRTEQKLEEFFNRGIFTQGQIYNNYLFNILKNYQGTLNDNQYDQLLKTVEIKVQEGKICKVIYHLLTYLDKLVNMETIQQSFIQGQYPTSEVLRNQIHHQLVGDGDFYQQQQFIGKNIDDLTRLEDVYGDKKTVDFTTRFNKYGFYPYTEKFFNTQKYFTHPDMTKNTYFNNRFQQPMKVYGDEYDNQMYKTQLVNDVVYPTTQYGYDRTNVIDYLLGHQFQGGLNNIYTQGYGFGRGFGGNYRQNILRY